MKRNHRIISICCALMMFLTVIAAPFSAKADTTQRFGAITDVVNVRQGPSTDHTIITKMAGGELVKILGEETASDGDVWYQCNFVQKGTEITGYIHEEYVVEAEETFLAQLRDQRFPEDYYAGLILLHEVYPNWKFVAYHTNLKWETVIKEETVIGRNMVYYTSNPLYIDLTDVDENGKQIGRDGNSWVTASKAAVEYYMDPRNFLNDPSIFMFESLSYTEGVYTKEGVAAILKNSFMAENYTCPDTKEVKNYAETFIEAGRLAGVSPYHLASRARQEQGKNGNALGNGTVSGYENYFNFFNISAYATSQVGAIVHGAQYASKSGSYGRPWTNQYKSICGGAQFLGTSYISKGQDTVYFQKFNVSNPNNLYNHQYMSNVKAPASEASIVKKGYTEEILQSVLIFEIPVYLNMPENPIPKPEDRKDEEEQGGQGNQGGATQPDSNVPVMTTTYKLNGSSLTGVALGTDAAALLNNIQVSEGSAALYDAAGTSKTAGAVVTGDVLKICKTDNTEYKTYTLVLYGDINSDSKISMADLVLVRKHLLDLSALKNSKFNAADINKDGKISMADLIFVRKHLLDISYISQG